MLDNILNWLNKFFASQPDPWNPPHALPAMPESPDRYYVYVSPERALHELRGESHELRKTISAKQHFIDFVAGKHGDNPEVLFRTAVETGSAQLSGYEFGQIWQTDADCFKAFRRAAEKAGFRVSYRQIESEGPEANRFVINVTPMAGAQ